jgi:periplasmic divalent cation tolerance protein
MDSLLAFSTFPNSESARAAVYALVDKKLVACGNILPGVQSVYRWKGEVESAEETLVIFKLAASNYDVFERELKSLHSYAVGEVIAIPITRGSGDYLRWIQESCARESGP